MNEYTNQPLEELAAMARDLVLGTGRGQPAWIQRTLMWPQPLAELIAQILVDSQIIARRNGKWEVLCRNKDDGGQSLPPLMISDGRRKAYEDLHLGPVPQWPFSRS